MLRRLARNLLLLVAVLGLMPGVNEALEQAAELIEHGHPAHTVPGEAHPLAAEHGCTPVQHQCPCHQGQSVDMRGAVAGGPFAENWPYPNATSTKQSREFQDHARHKDHHPKECKQKSAWNVTSFKPRRSAALPLKIQPQQRCQQRNQCRTNGQSNFQHVGLVATEGSMSIAQS